MAITIRPLTRTAQGTYDLGCDILPDLIQDDSQRPTDLDDAEVCMWELGYSLADEFTGWGPVYRGPEGDLLVVGDA